MGIIGKATSALAKGVVKEAAKPIAYGAAGLGVKAIDKTFERSDNKAKKKAKEAAPDVHTLLLEKKPYSWNDKYTIYDSNEMPKYTVKGSLTSMKRHLFVYDLEGKELGSVKEKLLAIRSPLSRESDPSDYEFEINGKKIRMWTQQQEIKASLLGHQEAPLPYYSLYIFQLKLLESSSFVQFFRLPQYTRSCKEI